MTITTADDQHTVTVSVGDTVILSLDSGFDWSNVEVADSLVLQVLGGPLPPGAQAVFRAASAGTSAITATGTVHCPPNTPCPALARLFRVTVIVR